MALHGVSNFNAAQGNIKSSFYYLIDGGRSRITINRPPAAKSSSLSFDLE